MKAHQNIIRIHIKRHHDYTLYIDNVMMGICYVDAR